MNTMLILFAAISASTLFKGVLLIIAVGLIAWLLWWLIDYAGLPEPFAKIARVVVAIAAVAFLIDAILKVAGQPGYISY